jgi:type I restriction enzyme S subunit
MKGWEEKTLSDLGKVARGKSRHRPRNADFLYGGEYPFIQTSDVKHANFRIKEYTQTYSEEGLKQSKLWKKDTLCITIAANIADTAILDIDACFPDSIMGFVPYENVSDVRFVKYCFDILQKKIQQISQGAAQDNLSLEKLLTVKFFVPDYPTQRKIASILSAYDDLIENNLKRIKLLEEIAQRTYEEWFVKFRVNGKQLKLNKESGLPEGWEKKRSDELFNIKIGKTPPREQEEWFRKDNLGIKWASIKDINNASVFISETSENITEEGVDKFNMNVATPGTVILSFKLTVGKVTIVAENMVTNEAIAHFNKIPKSNFNKSFVYCYLRGFNFDALGSTSSIGTAINSKIVKAMPFLVPDTVTLNSFQKIADPIFDKLEILLRENRLLKESRDILLPRLMSGVIEVG